MRILKIITRITPVLVLLLFTYSCGVPEFAKPGKVREGSPVNAKDRARKMLKKVGVSL